MWPQFTPSNQDISDAWMRNYAMEALLSRLHSFNEWQSMSVHYTSVDDERLHRRGNGWVGIEMVVEGAAGAARNSNLFRLPGRSIQKLAGETSRLPAIRTLQFGNADSFFQLESCRGSTDDAFLMPTTSTLPVAFTAHDYYLRSPVRSGSLCVRWAPRQLRFIWSTSLIMDRKHTALLIQHHDDDTRWECLQTQKRWEPQVLYVFL